MLAEAGVHVDDTVPNHWRVPPGPVAARDWAIEPDLSNAVPFAAAAAVTGGTVTITGWPTISVQPAPIILSILRLLGCDVAHSDSGLQVHGPARYGGFDMDLHEVGELAPSMAALAALAEPGSVSRLTGIAHLRGHETDRLAALSTEINRLGGDCAEEPDGLVITARPLHAGVWHSYADHRMAMAGAIIGLRVPGVLVEDIATTAKTLPQFPELWAAMLGRGSRVELGWTTTSPTCRSGRAAVRVRAPRPAPSTPTPQAAMVVTVDRGRWGCVLGGDPTSQVTAMRARELGRTPIVVGDEVDVVGDLSGRPDTLARIVRRGDRRTVLRRTADDTDPDRTGGGGQRRPDDDRGGTGRPAAAHRPGGPGADRRLHRRPAADPVPDQDRPGARRHRSPRSSPIWISP